MDTNLKTRSMTAHEPEDMADRVDAAVDRLERSKIRIVK